jgi:3-oxoadipate enol-lactonase
MNGNDSEAWRGTIDVDGCLIHVAIDGSDKAPPLMLSSSLGANLSMWEPQLESFSKHFRIIRYDSRGHGKSAVPNGPYTMERLGRDAVGILDGLGIEKTNWCGLSMGGMVGQWLGANAPSRVDKLILSNTTAYYSDKESWTSRISLVQAGGIRAVAAPSMERWFSYAFREREPDTVARANEMLMSIDARGYVGCCAAVRDVDHRLALSTIRAPTLVVAGLLDAAAHIEAHEFLRDKIANAALVILEASHLSNIERPKDYTDAVLQFLSIGSQI